jgi:hypothetical protein
MFKSIVVASALLASGAAFAQQAPQKDNFILGHGFVTPATTQITIPGHQTKDVRLPANADAADKSRNGTQDGERR